MMQTIRISTPNGSILVDTNNITALPSNRHITYQKQYRACGKATCTTCRNGRKHGPYVYAYWHEGARLRSVYVGKVHPGASLE